MPPMKNEYKANRADYRFMRGNVGQYQGTDVFVVPEKEFSLKESKKNSDLIYALADKSKKELTLVSGGMIIGEMSSTGWVTMYEKSSFYDDGSEKAWESEETKPADFPEFELPVVSSSGISVDDFLAGETLVDRFLRGLEF